LLLDFEQTHVLYIIFFLRSVSLNLLFPATEESQITEKTIEKEIQKLKNNLVEETGIPAWGLVAILIGNKECAFREGDFSINKFYYYVDGKSLFCETHNIK